MVNGVRLNACGMWLSSQKIPWVRLRGYLQCSLLRVPLCTQAPCAITQYRRSFSFLLGIHSSIHPCSLQGELELVSLTKENAVDLNSVGITLAKTVLGKRIDPVIKSESLSLQDILSTGRHLLAFSLITCRKSNLCTTLYSWNVTKDKYYLTQAKVKHVCI